MPPEQLATVAAEAAALYRCGAAMLVRGRAGEAVPVLRAAVAIDGGFAVANAALAVAEAEVDNATASREAIDRAIARRDISRRERQLVEVVALALGGSIARASVLGREHLQEFAADLLVAHVLCLGGADVTDLCTRHVLD